ncbi:MAG: hypothetical protein RLZZ538_1727 [Actinomycetota bacterium]
MQHAVEVTLADDQHITVGVAGDRRSTRAMVQERQFPHHGTSADGRQLLAASANRGFSFEDDERLSPRLTLFDQDPTGLERHLICGFHDASEILLRASGK